MKILFKGHEFKYETEVMAAGFTYVKDNALNGNELKTAIQKFDIAWTEYCALSNNKYSSSLYKDEYLNCPGIRETVEYFREQIRRSNI